MRSRSEFVYCWNLFDTDRLWESPSSTASASLSPPHVDHLLIYLPQPLYVFVHYSIIDYVHKHKIKISEVKRTWVGEEEAEVGQDHGREEGPSAIYHLGRDQVGCMVEEHAGGFLPHIFRQRLLPLAFHLRRFLQLPLRLLHSRRSRKRRC